MTSTRNVNVRRTPLIEISAVKVNGDDGDRQTEFRRPFILPRLIILCPRRAPPSCRINRLRSLDKKIKKNIANEDFIFQVHTVFVVCVCQQSNEFQPNPTQSYPANSLVSLPTSGYKSLKWFPFWKRTLLHRQYFESIEHQEDHPGPNNYPMSERKKGAYMTHLIYVDQAIQ